MEKLVFTNGCFDLLHQGHIYLLTEAAKYGRLIVGLNSDASVKRLKGPERPIWNQYKRRMMLQELDFIYKIIIFEENTPLKLIDSWQPDIIVKGDEYKREEVVGYHIVKQVITIPMYKDYSTTKLLGELEDI